MKKMLFILLLLPRYIVAFSHDGAESKKLAEFANNINKFNYLYPQEKVYLHFDNTAYFKGETIWFKAYVVTAENNALSQLSKVLYTELLTPEGKIAETQKLKIEGGQARGGFLLKDRYFSGYYQVRAYTRCMLNFGEHVVFSRVFPVYDQAGKSDIIAFENKDIKEIAIKPRNVRKGEKTEDINLALYPEGGNMVTGITNRIAFKVTDKEGKALDVTGKIYNSLSEEITEFSTIHKGMGSFILYPDGNKYIAITNHNGKEYRFDLPQSMPSGYTLRVENMHPKSISLQVEKTKDLAVQMLGITLACRGKVYIFKTFEADSTGNYSMRLQKENLPSGVVQITLFTPQGEILAQRQIFVNNNIQALPIYITNIRSTFEPYSPICIDLEVEDKNNNPIETNFSLSIRDEKNEMQTNHTDNLLYNLLLSSDLKGHIENPAYYFESNDNKHRLALDLLMLVQGWIRYPWKQMAGIEPFKAKFGIEKSLMIEGCVLSYTKKNPQENIEVTMWMTSKDGWSQQGKCTTDKDGHFNFALADIIGTFNLNLWAKKKDEKGKYNPYESRITINRNISPTVLTYQYVNTNLSVEKQNKTNEWATEEPLATIGKVTKDSIKWSLTLPEVEIKEKMSSRQIMLRNPKWMVYDVAKESDKFLDEGESTPAGILDFLVSVDPYFSYSITYGVERMRGADAEITAIYKGRKASFWVNTMGSGGRSFSVAELNIDEVENIVIINDQASQGAIINIMLYEFGSHRRAPKGLRKTYYEGFTTPVEFYSPDYSILPLSEPDVRRTLYWNPDVKTDSLGRTSVIFFNNGTCKKINISAEGLTSEGIPTIYK